MTEDVLKYISRQPSPQKEILQEIRNVISETIPLAQELMSYGVPAFKQDGKTILYAAFKKHVGLYPEPNVIEALKAELGEYNTSKGAIQFSLEKPIPYLLIKKIVQYKFN